MVGADHPIGQEIVKALLGPGREVRAFVSDPIVAVELRAAGTKVAIGDLSDEGHVAAAATNCFSIAYVAPAIADGRELAFLPAEAIPEAWAQVAADAAITRAIWVGQGIPVFNIREVAEVAIEGIDLQTIATEVARLDDLRTLES